MLNVFCFYKFFLYVVLFYLMLCRMNKESKSFNDMVNFIYEIFFLGFLMVKIGLGGIIILGNNVIISCYVLGGCIGIIWEF